jgi:hypothetical protein
VDLLLRLAGRQIERPAEPDARGDLREELVDRADADRRQHLPAVGLGGGGVPTHASELS